MRRMAAAVVVAGVILTGCGATARGSGGYQREAGAYAKAAGSAAATGAMAAKLWTYERGFSPYLDVLATGAEDDLSVTQGSFDAIQPPLPADDATRDELDALLTEASDALSRLRIAIRRADNAAITAAGRDAAVAATRLADFSASRP